MAQPQQPPPVPLPEAPLARHLGDLARSQTRWSVYLETRTAGSLAQGRLHFVEGTRHKSTGWIFRELTEQDINAIYDYLRTVTAVDHRVEKFTKK